MIDYQKYRPFQEAKKAREANLQQGPQNTQLTNVKTLAFTGCKGTTKFPKLQALFKE